MARTMTLDRRPGPKHILYVIQVDGKDEGNGFYGFRDGLQVLSDLRARLQLTNEEVRGVDGSIRALPPSPFQVVSTHQHE